MNGNKEREKPCNADKMYAQIVRFNPGSVKKRVINRTAENFNRDKH